MEKTNNIYIKNIQNYEELKDIFFTITMLLGSTGFLIVGISSYININLINFLNAKEIVFFPQGLTMSLYGSLGLIISSYQVRDLKLTNIVKVS